MNHDPRVIALALTFVHSLFEDGRERTPMDLDMEVLGGHDLSILATVPTLPVFNRSPFGYALNELIKEGRIIARQDDKGWYYRSATPLGDMN